MMHANEAEISIWPAFSMTAEPDSIAVKQENTELRILNDELGHRIKNLVTVIQSIARQTMQRATTKDDFAAQFSGRLGAFGRSLDLVIANDWRGADISDLVRLVLTPFGVLDDVQFSVKGPPIALSSVAARNIGLALHELATNACKFGALSVPEGKVAIRWTLSGSSGRERFHMTWCESDGPIVAEPTRRGFGRQIIQQVTAQALAAKVTYEFLPAGVRWTVAVPAVLVVTALSDRCDTLQ